MASISSVLYIGVTRDLMHRVDQHKQEVFGGFSKRYNCKKLVYYELFSRIEDAIKREKQIKKWRREKKVALIERENKNWIDLNIDLNIDWR